MLVARVPLPFSFENGGEPPGSELLPANTTVAGHELDLGRLRRDGWHLRRNLLRTRRRLIIRDLLLRSLQFGSAVERVVELRRGSKEDAVTDAVNEVEKEKETHDVPVEGTNTFLCYGGPEKRVGNVSVLWRASASKKSDVLKTWSWNRRKSSGNRILML